MGVTFVSSTKASINRKSHPGHGPIFGERSIVEQSNSGASCWPGFIRVCACEGLTQAVFVVGVGDGFGEGVSGDYSIYKAKRSP